MIILIKSTMIHIKTMNILIFMLIIFISASKLSTNEQKAKSVMVVLLARNKEHTLPYFLSHLEKLTYPKNRISLFVRSDHNSDKTNLILKQWLNQYRKYFHSVDELLIDHGSPSYIDEGSPANWTADRFDHIINLKEEALNKARQMWADYILFLDLDVFIFDNDIIQTLINENKPIISPMLNSLGMYSNFWAGMTDNYWYIRTDDYIPILERKQRGCYDVPMVHSFILVDLSLTKSDKLSFLSQNIPVENLPNDDIIGFALSSKINKMNMFICNQKSFGFIPPPLEETDNLRDDYSQIVDLRLEAGVDHEGFVVSDALKKYVMPDPVKSTLGFDHIYLINLARRTDRRKKMIKNLDILGVDANFVDAVDGKKINASYLDNLGIKQLHNYKDPWKKRDMTFGEIGCFLSHYFIWEDIVEKEYKKVLVFEDDIKFEPLFKKKLNYLSNQMDQLRLSWDFVYLGRKKLKNYEEWVEGSDTLVHPNYSYWTLCYMITFQGAKKLLRPEPLRKMVPVDEYIPIMFDEHPEDVWKAQFFPRNLEAYSAWPLLVYPTHYTGEEGYVSDTEESPIIVDVLPAEGILSEAGLGVAKYSKNEL